jgi:hypothetical protein
VFGGLTAKSQGKAKGTHSRTLPYSTPLDWIDEPLEISKILSPEWGPGGPIARSRDFPAIVTGIPTHLLVIGRREARRQGDGVALQYWPGMRHGGEIMRRQGNRRSCEGWPGRQIEPPGMDLAAKGLGSVLRSSRKGRLVVVQADSRTHSRAFWTFGNTS